ncbi:Phosphate regulon sensor protein PhoR (SphS) [hydrothermal vent metagenome]|uniref:histidine kinase n=1 Tax=hydrothermal vent metagenome TaxID=652676 RepID=A0A3B1C7E5_9ZZZZ
MKHTTYFWKVFPLNLALLTLSTIACLFVAGGLVMEPDKIVFITFMILLTSAMLGIIASNTVKKSLKDIAHGAARYAIGLFDKPVAGGDIKEIADIAEKLNKMGSELKGRINAGANEAQSGDAVFACLMEGILAVDTNYVILKINPVAKLLLDIPSAKVEGLSIKYVHKRSEFLKFVDEGLKARTQISKEVTIDTPRERIIQIVQSPLYKSDGEYWGQVMSLNDVTRLRRLENLRRDFAANVSHELRTPITSIQASVETLLSGAMNDRQPAERFLRGVSRNTKRLSAIIEDLLSLSRLENKEVVSQGLLVDAPIKEILQKILNDMAYKADEKDIKLELDCPDDLTASISIVLLERALANLIDNAINYSDNGKVVWVSSFIQDNTLSVHVRDQGYGIEKKHLERIFERFYRVDSARSRKLGGTGLGLSIVKHSILAHGGKVTVESVPDEGSLFSMHIPMKIYENFERATA